MKYATVIAFILFNFTLFSHNGYSQMDTIENFMLFEVSNAEMESVLKDVEKMASDCPFFSALKKKYYVAICFSESDRISAQIFPQNVTTICFYRNNEGMKCDGVCFFDNQIFYIQDFSYANKLKDYFVEKDTVVDLYFDSNENFFDHLYPANVYLETSYIIKNGKFLKNDDYVDIEAQCGLNDRIEFDYIIKHGDTWESIAEKCCCDEKNLREEYPEYKYPIPGFMISVTYFFDEAGNFQGVRRPY